MLRHVASAAMVLKKNGDNLEREGRCNMLGRTSNKG